MFSRDLVRMRIDLSITPKGPVLIRSGRDLAIGRFTRCSWG